MGWANCGEDKNGRPIGYAHEATCDHPGCEEEIDRGLGHVCGEMHGEDEVSCGGYFCEGHRTVIEDHQGDCVSVCDACHALAIENGYDEESGAWKVLLH